MAVKLDTAYFKKMINSCKYTMSTEKNECRPQLKYINIDVADGILRMWSMNGYSIQIEELEVKSEDNFKSKFNQLYIPPNDEEVVLERVNDMLEITFLPSKFKMSIPQDDTLTRFNIEKFIKNQMEKNFKVSFTRESLERALKGVGKKDRVVFSFNTTSNIQPVLMKNNEHDVKSTSYIMPTKVAE